MLLAFSIAVFVLAALPCALFVQNLRGYRPLPNADFAASRGAVSVLIPARNEEPNIEACVCSALASRGVELEVIVLDDQSADCTSALVQKLAAKDSRVHLISNAQPLPEGWSGKNFACSQLAAQARHSLLVFLDADVRITDPAALARLVRFMDENNVALASGVPHEITRTWMEKLIVPLIHFVLLGFLPLHRMRATTDPRFAAACGQLIAIRRPVYEQSGGHVAIRGSLHDAVALARNVRAHGFRTDLFDATDAFSCRMYRGAREVWRGFVKNAHEGLGAPGLIVPATLLLLGGQFAPFVVLATMPQHRAVVLFSTSAVVCALLPRVAAAIGFSQPTVAAFLHPLSILFLLAIQWDGFLRRIFHKPVAWRGRVNDYSHASARRAFSLPAANSTRTPVNSSASESIAPATRQIRG